MCQWAAGPFRGLSGTVRSNLSFKGDFCVTSSCCKFRRFLGTKTLACCEISAHTSIHWWLSADSRKHLTQCSVLFLFLIHCPSLANACFQQSSRLKWGVCWLGSLSLLECFCNFVTDQTASESSKSLCYRSASAVSPWLQQIFMMHSVSWVF